MPVGSSVEISFGSELGTLFSGLSDSQADKCWATEKYSSCTVSSGTVTIAFAEDIAANTPIEVYFDDAVTLPDTAGEKTGAINVVAKWQTLTIS